jgi:glutamate racemase
VTSGRALLGLAQSYLEPLQRAGVDTLVLGCTHYPMLAGLIGLVMGDDVTLVSSADETAREAYRILTERDLLRAPDAGPPAHQFLATGDPEPFARLAQRFLGRPVPVSTAPPVPSPRTAAVTTAAVTTAAATTAAVTSAGVTP